MALLFTSTLPSTGGKQQVNVKHLHQMECKACPLAALNNRNPNMPATGSEKPLVYVLGEGPGKDEDDLNKQFVGESGRLLRPRIPRDFKKHVRFNNVVRTRPFRNETPSQVAIECCRPSVVRDIERTKPKAIFGFGNVPLEWVSGFSGVTLWRGRKMPVRVGTHTCWYYPMLHPAYLVRQGRGEGKTSGTEDERVFAMDMRRAFEEIDDLPKPVVHTPKDVWDGIELILDGGKEGLKQLADALKWAAEQPDIGIDYETDALRPYPKWGVKPRVLSAAVCTDKRGYAFSIDHPEAQWTSEEKVEVRRLWKKFLKEAVGRRWVHNLAFELEWSAVEFEHPVRVGQWEDTSVQACIIDERKGKSKPGCFSLEFLVQVYFGFNLKKLSNLNRKNLADAPLELVLRYNGGDAKYHCALGLKQQAIIEEEDLTEPYSLGLRRVPTVVKSQVKGVPVDQPEVKLLKKKYQTRLKEIREEIFALPVVAQFEKVKREKFNPLSNPHVLYVFKDLLKRNEVAVEDKYSKKTKYSAKEEILEVIDHPLAGLIVRLRKANKQLSTYIIPYDENEEDSVVYDDGLLHPTFNTIFAETGRLSCEDPNLQNEPKRDGEAVEVRRKVAAKKKRLILTFDYGQIEARVIAMFTKDKTFVKALWENYDIHMEWAERIARAYPKRIGGKANLTDKKAMKDFRTDIKNQWTFPLFFGAKLSSAANYLTIPEETLKPLYNEFWRIFSPTKDWQESVVEFYNEYGYVECLTKRRRRGPLSLNQIINSPVQGTAAEIVMDGMCRLSETSDRLGDPDLQPEINIHDDLTFVSSPLERVDEIAETVITHMLDVPFKWAKVVPISVEMGVGENWMPYDEKINPTGVKDAGTFSSDKWFGEKQ